MSYFFGLYFGNTNMCIAAYRNGKSEVIANSAGDRSTPAAVAIVSGEKCVGMAAKQCMLRNTGNTITHIKDLLLDCERAEAEDGSETTITNGTTEELKPYEALVLLFSNMVSIARNHCHENDVPVVVTVPLTFSLNLREIVEKAATEAGFRLLRIISEPSASMLAYDLGQNSPYAPSMHCLVYRLGGTSLDVTIFHVSGGVYRSLASVSRKDISGNVFTEKLANFVAQEFHRKYKIDVKESKRSVMKLRSAAETCKHALSIMTSAQCFAESIYDGIDLNVNVSQARFESLISSDLPLCFEAMIDTLKEASLTASDINKVVLTGGSCKIPKLQKFLADKFPQGSVLTSISPDEAIALGATKEAMFISCERPISEQECHVNTLSNSVCLRKVANSETDRTTLVALFHKGVPIPCSRQLSFPVDKEIPVTVEICEKPADVVGDNLNVLGKFTLQPSDGISIDAEITVNRKLKLSCKDITTGFKKLVII